MKCELKARVIALSITLIIMLSVIVKNNIFLDKNTQVESNEVLAMNSYIEYSIEEDIDNFILENQSTFDFYCNMFGISLQDLKNAIIKSNNTNTFNRQDIGNTNSIYESLDKNLIDYLFSLKSSNPKLFQQTYVNGNNYSKEYIYGLLNYFSSIYENVDFDVLASIAYIESGNLNAKYMMSCNNIYGGMSSNGLIKYQNIEFGVLSYVKLMSEKYYAKGLDTIDKIARIYNPVSSTWSSNVKSMLNKFNNYETIDNVNNLLNLNI